MWTTQWIGFVGKILTGNPWVFTIKLIGLSCKFSHIFPSSNSMNNPKKCGKPYIFHISVGENPGVPLCVLDVWWANGDLAEKISRIKPSFNFQRYVMGIQPTRCVCSWGIPSNDHQK